LSPSGFDKKKKSVIVIGCSYKNFKKRRFIMGIIEKARKVSENTIRAIKYGGPLTAGAGIALYEYENHNGVPLDLELGSGAVFVGLGLRGLLARSKIYDSDLTGRYTSWSIGSSAGGAAFLSGVTGGPKEITAALAGLAFPTAAELPVRGYLGLREVRRSRRSKKRSNNRPDRYPLK
jgi:hypothetical protein